MIQRYDFEHDAGQYCGVSYSAMKQSPDGEYVTFSDAESDKAAAVKDWRDMCDRLAEAMNDVIDNSIPDDNDAAFCFREKARELLTAYNAMKDGQPASEPTPQAGQWVKCSERLPVFDGDGYTKSLIVMTSDSPTFSIACAYQDTDGVWWFDNKDTAFDADTYVIAWYDLPEYKEAK